ncbi:MAG: excinuclease ABC subunit UvrC [Peptostreptococcales bacterium]
MMKEQLKNLPDKPGVYLMKDEYGEIIYIGKALSLKNRVRQYFQSLSGQAPKVKAMVSNIADFEYIITDSEIEALILESNLIKKNQPKYNILLRDDKTFPYIKVTVNEKFPRVLKTRQVLKDGAKYFGPYTNAGAVNRTIDIINRIYPLKKCSRMRFNLNHKLCLNYHIGHCLGMCIYPMDEEEYGRMIEKIIELLQGEKKKVIDYLTEKMEEAAENMNFEIAAEYRDYIMDIEALMEKQKIVLSTDTDMDVIAMAKGQDIYHAMVFFVRQGKLLGRESYTLKADESNEISIILSEFIKQFYTENAYIPKEIAIKEAIEEGEMIEKMLTMKKGSKVRIFTPHRGEKKALLDMVIKNVIEISESMEQKYRKERETIKEVLLYLKDELELDTVPLRIEAYDISNTAGTNSVASMVVFEEGKAKPNHYRRFKIKTIEGPNDYGSLQEVIYRRFKRVKDKRVEEDTSFGTIPNLLLIDGGEKQVKAVEDVLEALKIDIPVAGLVKNEKHRTRGLIYKQQEIDIDPNRNIKVFLSKVQDEVHRFALSYHKSLREKDLYSSELDQIKGVGKKRKAELFKYFQSIESMKKAPLEELLKVPGMDIKTAEEIVNYFSGERKLK